MTVKVKHKRFDFLKTKLNFCWCNNLKRNNFAGKLKTKTSIQLNSRSKRKYLPNFSSSFVSSELKVITNQKNSERGQLTTDEESNYQINGSHEEINCSVHQHIIRTNIRSLVRSNQRKKIYFYLSEVLYNCRMRFIRSQLISGCNWWSYNKQA